MARFSGKIGYTEGYQDDGSGVWTHTIKERACYGDVIRNRRKNTASEVINDDLNLGNEFSIVSDTYARAHFPRMLYVEWMGTKWKITDIDVQYPRLILSVGGVYNETETA